jgi:hypothetical protein
MSIQHLIEYKLSLKHQLEKYRNGNYNPPTKISFKRVNNQNKVSMPNRKVIKIMNVVSIFQLNKELLISLTRKKNQSWTRFLSSIIQITKSGNQKQKIYLQRKLHEERNNFLNKFQKQFIKDLEMSLYRDPVHFRLENYNCKIN